MDMTLMLPKDGRTMIDLDSELAGEYLETSRDRLAAMEADLLVLETSGGRIDEERMNRIFRSVHAVQEGAAALQLVKIGELSRELENVLALILRGQVVPTPELIRVLL